MGLCFSLFCLTDSHCNRLSRGRGEGFRSQNSSLVILKERVVLCHCHLKSSGMHFLAHPKSHNQGGWDPMIGNHMMLRRGSSLKEDVRLFPKESGEILGGKIAPEVHCLESDGLGG